MRKLPKNFLLHIKEVMRNIVSELVLGTKIKHVNNLQILKIVK